MDPSCEKEKPWKHQTMLAKQALLVESDPADVRDDESREIFNENEQPSISLQLDR